MEASSSSTSKSGLSPLQLLMLGGMLFSMFFGAGNLILPPLLGLKAGVETPLAMVGFLITGIGMPVFGIIAVALAGDIRQLAGRVHPWFAAIYIALIYLSIGPFLAIPRTSSTAFEMMKPLFPELADNVMFAAAFSVVFFILAFSIALRPNKLSKILGRVTGPLLLALLACLIGGALFSATSVDTPALEPYNAGALSAGFLTGYQTMDLLASLCFGLIVALNVRDQGVTEPASIARAVCIAGIVAGTLMAIIYCGLAFVGASMASQMPEVGNGAAILAASAFQYFQGPGAVLIAAIFLLACLNVCTGLVSCCSEYFHEVCPKVPFIAWAAAFAIIGCILSLAGLDTILKFSVPLLLILYPPSIALMVMGLLHKFCDKFALSWPFAVLATTLASTLSVLRGIFAPNLVLPLDFLPFADIDLGWVSIFVVAGLIGALASYAAAKCPCACHKDSKNEACACSSANDEASDAGEELVVEERLNAEADSFVSELEEESLRN